MRRAKQTDSETPATTGSTGDTPGRRTTGRIREHSRSIFIALGLGALVIGAAYVVSKPGSDTPAANGASAGTTLLRSRASFRAKWRRSAFRASH